MPHTMEEVAKLAGVSPTTVSRVLSKNPNISAATAKLVMEAVEKLDYRPNVHARRLAVGKSDLFGLVISEIVNPFFAEIIQGFQAAAWDKNFDVLLLNTEYNPRRAEAVVEKLIENSVRGVAILTSSLDDRFLTALTDRGIAVVTLNPVSTGRLISTVAIDYERGLMQAIDHVAALGHRSAAVIAGPSSNRTASAIEKVLVQRLRQKKLDAQPIVHSDYRFGSGASAVQGILSAKNAPTVIFCCSDLIAMGAISALEEAGVNVPGDISVVGVDDLPFSFLARPALTTIRVAREELGNTAFAALDKLLKLKRQNGSQYIVETELVVRKSTAARRDRP